VSKANEAKKTALDLPPMDVVKEAQKLIAIPSVTGNEGRIGQYLHDRFRELGCDARLIEAVPGRYNVTAFWPGQEMELGLLFQDHLDTIPVYNMEKPFEPLIRDGHIWGRGSVDQKGGIAAALLAEELPVFKPKGLDQVQASLNLGLMNGGVAYNRVPDECELCFDRRLVPGEDQNKIIQGIKEIAGHYEQIEGLEI